MRLEEGAISAYQYMTTLTVSSVAAIAVPSVADVIQWQIIAAWIVLSMMGAGTVMGYNYNKKKILPTPWEAFFGIIRCISFGFLSGVLFSWTKYEWQLQWIAVFWTAALSEYLFIGAIKLAEDYSINPKKFIQDWRYGRENRPESTSEIGKNIK